MILKKEYKLSPVEFIKFQLNMSINVPEPVLNETDITVLSYIYLYGAEAKNEIFKHKILTSMNSCYNYFSRLKNMGYLVKLEEGYFLNPEIIIVNDSFIMACSVSLNSADNTVFHPYYKNEK